MPEDRPGPGRDVYARSGGKTTRTNINVRPLPAVTLTSEFNEINAGETTTLSWSSIDTQHCTAVGAWSGERLMSGEFEVSPVVDSVYEIGCTVGVPVAPLGFGESAAVSAAAEPVMVRDRITVTVIPEPQSALLQGLALLAVGFLRRRTRAGCEADCAVGTSWTRALSDNFLFKFRRLYR